jgi:hypothetical protein
VIDDLKEKLWMQATVAYYLMLDNHHRMSSGYLRAEFDERKESFIPVLPADSMSTAHSMYGSPLGRHRAAIQVGSMDRRGPSPAVLQQRVAAERKWALGLQVCLMSI